MEKSYGLPILLFLLGSEAYNTTPDFYVVKD